MVVLKPTTKETMFQDVEIGESFITINKSPFIKVKNEDDGKNCISLSTGSKCFLYNHTQVKIVTKMELTY